MKKKILPLLICLNCSGSLGLTVNKEVGNRIKFGRLKCKACNASYQIVGDIACFQTDIRKKLSYDYEWLSEAAIDREVHNKWLKYFNQRELESLQNEWQWMIKNGNLKESRVHLDWASGTGRFLKNIKKYNGNIIALERDYVACFVLKNVLKKTKIYSGTSIICGDARNMPLASGVVDSVSSWSGLDEPKIGKALNESKRVLRKGKTLVISGLSFADNSKSLRIALKEKMHFAKSEAAYHYIDKIGFKKIKREIFYTGKWTSSNDFIPKKGDRYAMYGLAGKKP